jgi:hypothetical protein
MMRRDCAKDIQKRAKVRGVPMLCPICRATIDIKKCKLYKVKIEKPKLVEANEAFELSKKDADKKAQIP